MFDPQEAYDRPAKKSTVKTPNLLDAQVIVTAVEAVCGLVIEGVFIAMLTQKFFSR